MKRHIKSNVHWLGKTDWELRWFHGMDYSTGNGSSQNAYLIQEEKTVLIDAVWKPHSSEFVDNLKKEVDLKKIDFIVAQHGEVDHSGALPALLAEIPDVPIYCTANCVKSIVGQYHHPEWNFHVVKTGDRIDIGNGKELIFIEMRMLHWPDSMATFLTGDNILFSMDAFGQHYAADEMFDDQSDKCKLWVEAMKYYANIINPYAMMLKLKMKELDALDLPIEMICPSHGVVWREGAQEIYDAYKKWCDNYSENQITICYDTMWDGTMKLAHTICNEMRKVAPDYTIKVYNLSKSDKNDVMTDVFKSKAIIVGSPTVNQHILSSVGGWLHFLKECRFKGKKAGVFGCYGWSGEGNATLREELTHCGFQVVEPEVKSNWNPTDEHTEQARLLAEAIMESIEG